uniref:Uncharacterized protein n=1 Tax=Heterorhabditis bacteriophora TaxID=37862 RepID=A0A1I7XBU9_HETBA
MSTSRSGGSEIRKIVKTNKNNKNLTDTFVIQLASLAGEWHCYMRIASKLHAVVGSIGAMDSVSTRQATTQRH